MDFTRPLPTPTPTSAPFWDALKDGVVKLQRCNDCDAWVFYPRSRCPQCLADALTWHSVSGLGTLYTFTIARQPTSPHFAGEVPQRLGVVELDEGVRLTTTLVNVADQDIRIGMRVKPYFDQVADDVTLLRYQPA
ncbi:MAG TPA: OB-fold domain-containing protein [Pseudomonadales bacterium]